MKKKLGEIVDEIMKRNGPREPEIVPVHAPPLFINGNSMKILSHDVSPLEQGWSPPPPPLFERWMEALYGARDGSAPGLPSGNTAVAVLEEPKPEPARVEVDDDATEYARLARSVGYRSKMPERSPLYQRIVLFLQREEIPVYRFELVQAYLESLARKAGRWRVAWTPIASYSQAVPVEVLRLADRVKTGLALPEQAFRFEVSEIKAVPDPFLALALHTGEKIVVAKWDEPGFKIAGVVAVDVSVPIGDPDEDDEDEDD
jgi:hypothetical protein